MEKVLLTDISIPASPYNKLIVSLKHGERTFSMHVRRSVLGVAVCGVCFQQYVNSAVYDALWNYLNSIDN